MIFSNISGGISRIEAVILLVLFGLFIAYTIYMGKKKSKEDSKVVEEKNKNKTIKNIILIILGIVGLKFGGDFVVNNAVNIAQMFNISEKVISLTILAIGTSLPELVTSVTAAIKGNSDIAIGNIIGSNIFNILLILGVSSVIKPITFNSSYNMDLSILCISTVILALFPTIPPKNKMSRANGLIYVLMYGAYMTMLFLG